MSDLLIFYNENGEITSSAADPATRQFYADYLLIDRPLDAFGSLEEVGGCDWDPDEYDFLFSNKNTLIGLFRACDIQAQESQQIATWQDSSGCGNDIVTLTGNVVYSNNLVKLTTAKGNRDITFSKDPVQPLNKKSTTFIEFEIDKIASNKEVFLVEIQAGFVWIEFEFGHSNGTITFCFNDIVDNNGSNYYPGDVLDIDITNSRMFLTVICSEDKTIFRLNQNIIKSIDMPQVAWSWQSGFWVSPTIGGRIWHEGKEYGTTLSLANIISFSTTLSESDCLNIESFLMKRFSNG